MRRTLLLVVLLLVVLTGAAFAGSGQAGVNAAQANPMDRCGDEDFEVTADSIMASPVPEATATAIAADVPNGLYRMVDQRFGALLSFELGGTPVIETHGTSVGVFCLMSMGSVPVEEYGSFVITIWLAEDAAGPLHIILEGYASDPLGGSPTGSVELCSDAQCGSPIQSIDLPSELDLQPGQAIRLVNPAFGLSNPGAETVVFTVASLSPSGGACPTRCWVSP